jgi:hypothetical protein
MATDSKSDTKDKDDRKENKSVGDDIRAAQDASQPPSSRQGENDDMVPDASGLGSVSRSQLAAEEALKAGGPARDADYDGNVGTVQQASQEGDKPGGRNVGTVRQASEEGDKPGGPNVGTVQQASQEGDKPRATK